MIDFKQMAIIKKDLRNMVSNKRLFAPLLIVPLMFTIILPTIFILSISFAPNDTTDIQPFLDMLHVNIQSSNFSSTIIGIIFNYIFPLFFIMIPVMSASIMAASSFVGEKEKKTLETLLYSPLTLKQIFIAKVLASFFLSMIISILSFIVMVIIVETETILIVGTSIVLSINWLITMLLLSPSISLLAITLIVRGSAKSKSVEEAQQKSVFLILPIILLMVGQFTGLFLINVWLLLSLSLIFAVIAIVVLKKCLQNFSYETLLS